MVQDVRNIFMQKLNDEHLQRSGFVFKWNADVIFEVYRSNDNQTSSWVELQENNKNKKSLH